MTLLEKKQIYSGPYLRKVCFEIVDGHLWRYTITADWKFGYGILLNAVMAIFNLFLLTFLFLTDFAGRMCQLLTMEVRGVPKKVRAGREKGDSEPRWMGSGVPPIEENRDVH